MEQLSKDIKDEENRVADATTDTSLVSAKSQSAIDGLKLAVYSAKKVYSNPNPTLNDIIKGSNSLIMALDVFDSSTSTYQPPSTYLTSDNDEQVWQYCVDRCAYYDTLTTDGYSADKYNTEVFNDDSTKFGISASEVQATWDKVDKVKTGVSN